MRTLAPQGAQDLAHYGRLSAIEQQEILEESSALWVETLGHRPYYFRLPMMRFSMYWRRKDSGAAHAVLPAGQFPEMRALWTGGQPDAHRASAVFRPGRARIRQHAAFNDFSKRLTGPSGRGMLATSAPRRLARPVRCELPNDRDQHRGSGLRAQAYGARSPQHHAQSLRLPRSSRSSLSPSTDDARRNDVRPPQGWFVRHDCDLGGRPGRGACAVACSRTVRLRRGDLRCLRRSRRNRGDVALTAGGLSCRVVFRASSTHARQHDCLGTQDAGGAVSKLSKPRVAR